MVRKIALIISICLMSLYASAHDVPCPESAAPPEPERISFAGGEYYVVLDADGGQSDVLVVLPKKPMLQVRLGQYGNLTQDPQTRELIINRKLEDKVTPAGKEIYGLLDSMRDQDDSFHVFQFVILRYDSVTMRKYARIEFADYIGQILKAFE